LTLDCQRRAGSSEAFEPPAQPHVLETRIGDAGLADLTGLAALEFIDFDGTRITDAGLVHLNKHRNLSALDLRRTASTVTLAYLPRRPRSRTTPPAEGEGLTAPPRLKVSDHE
jgi:hypothetical protein